MIGMAAKTDVPELQYPEIYHRMLRRAAARKPKPYDGSQVLGMKAQASPSPAQATLFPELFTAAQAGDLKLKNRVVLAALTRCRAVGRNVNSVMMEYYLRRVSAGMVITEACSVSESANGFRDTPGMYLPEHSAGWQTLVKKLHGEGCTIVCQLWHAGRMSHSSFLGGRAPMAPSAIAVQKQYREDPENNIAPNGIQGADDLVYHHETPTELSTAEVEAIVQDYVKASKLAQEAGFDGIEIHSATGYLIDTFLQRCSNERSDKYEADRFTFLREILAGIAQTSFPLSRVGVKISPNAGFNGMGSADNYEHYLGLAQNLNELGVAYLHVMDGISPGVEEKWWGKMTTTGFHGKCEPLALSDLKKVTGDMFLIGNSNYTAKTAAQRVSEGNASAISFGVPFLANPDLPIRFKKGLELADPPAQEAWFAPCDKYREHPRWGYLSMETDHGSAESSSGCD